MSKKKSDGNSAANNAGIKRRDLWLGSTSLVAATAIASTTESRETLGGAP